MEVTYEEFFEDEDFELISDHIYDQGSWSTYHYRISKHLPSGKFFRLYYDVGSTEYQDNSWKHGDIAPIEEVVPKEIKTITYVKV